MMAGMSQIARLFSALSDPSRLSIVKTLMRRDELPAGVLSDAAPISGSAISRHLKVLREAGPVHMRVNGPQRLYSVRLETHHTQNSAHNTE